MTLQDQRKANRRATIRAKIPVFAGTLEGDLELPDDIRGAVIFAHGSGSSRHSPRNKYVARVLQDAGIATLLLDLLTVDEESLDIQSAEYRFDIQLLADRLQVATRWLAQHPQMEDVRVGYFGASTGAAAALLAAAELPGEIAAVVSRGGRPDLAGKALGQVQAPTLLIVGGEDHAVIEMNREAMARLKCEKRMEIIAGATHLFEEAGALDEVARLARLWFEGHLGRGAVSSYVA
jgi:putative phosphoribosyl transferase